LSAPRRGTGDGFVLALTGGVGGAKLCLGLQRVLPPGALRIIVNTGDDFEHLGLAISPDVDTTLYTLAGLANTELGWGRQDETWSFMSALAALGGPTWFRLGDGDLALHVERTRRLAAGETLTAIVADIARRFGIAARIMPMSDDPVRTIVRTAGAGELGFQEYFVRERCAPAIAALRYAGAAAARISSAAVESLADPALQAVVIVPSNPYLSIDPVLAVPGMRSAVRARGAPVIAVTPLIGDCAIKGPTAKIMRELGLAPSPLTVLAHYGGLVDGFVLDERDAALAKEIDIPIRLCDTLMRSLADRERVARCTLELAQALRPGAGA
jgi:LPPG:FO 2-phospho-L-lactate transferase